MRAGRRYRSGRLQLHPVCLAKGSRVAGTSNVEWLLREAMDERALRISERAVVDNDSWRATIERLQIGPGLRVFLTDVQAHQDVTVEARDDRTDQWMGSQVTIAGRADIDFLDGERTHASADHAVLFRSPGRRAAYTVKAGARFHSAGYGLDVGRIVRLFEGEVPAALGFLLEPEVDASRVLAMHGSRFMSNLASTLFAPGLNGPLRHLMMEGAVIQLLAVQAAAATERPIARRRRALTVGERDALQAARLRLLADMRRPPSLGELALAVGLTEKRLNAGFQMLFGTTVFETLRNQRLEHARLALQSEAVSLKEVSFRVGYNHVSNFVGAFTARYDAPPRQYLDQASRLRLTPLTRRSARRR
jgi:AraC-like DNA-binding protein